MLRAILHAIVASSLVAGPPATGGDSAAGDPGRGYAGTEVVEVEPRAEAEAATPEPAGEATPAATSTRETTTPTPAAETTPATPANVPVAEGPAEDEPVDDVPYDPLVDSPEAIRARSWVRSGAVFVAVGGVLAIGGIAMSTANVNSLAMQNVCMPRQDVAGNGCQEGARNRAAMTLGIPGALLLAGGIAMLAVGKAQQRRLRASLRASRRDVFVGLQLAF